MSKYVIIWTVVGVIAGVALGALIGAAVGHDKMVGWIVLMAVSGPLFAGLLAYANDQHRKVRRPDLFE